jgi:branched-chain amino acid transport system ATP-binding protein
MSNSATPILSIRDLHAWYGESHVLHGIDLNVHAGECITLLGRNGAGRSSTLRAILGLIEKRQGSIQVMGQEVIHAQPHHIARLGIGYCPEERGIYASLTAEENLTLLPSVGSDGMTLEQIYTMFPNLKERAHSPGTRLSGGEQQMLAMARILRTGAKLLLLDEITEGLAPVIVQKLGQVIRELKSRGFTLVLVEQNFRFAQHLADRHYVIEHGRVVETIARSEVNTKQDRLNELLGI